MNIKEIEETNGKSSQKLTAEKVSIGDKFTVTVEDKHWCSYDEGDVITVISIEGSGSVYFANQDDVEEYIYSEMVIERIVP